MELRPLFALALALPVTIASAQSLSEPSPEQQRRLIEQKISLVQTLLASPAAKSAESSDDAEARNLMESARQAFERGKAALTQNRLNDAGTSADEALKSVSALSRRVGSGGPALVESAQKKNIEDLQAQLAAYRESLVDLTREPKTARDAQKLVATIDEAREEARRLAESRRLADAARKLGDAYRATVEGLSRLRNGQQVVLSLNFATPADEFSYEQRRYASSETMVDMMVREGRAEGGRRGALDEFLSQGRKLRNEAEQHARTGNFKEAIAVMEKANVQMTRALQALGLQAY
jgi:hypothetical protein